jgi:restriction system protein
MNEVYEDIMEPWHAKFSDGQAEDCSFASEFFTSGILGRELSLVTKAHNTITIELRQQLLAYIHCQSHSFFESLIIDVILALGYAGRKRDLARKIGRSGDGGVDGIIDLDELGLDAIYLQAKRLRPNSSVAVSAVRDFVGSLEARHASKGVFVTTGVFTKSAYQVISAISKKVVLIDGQRLADLMIRHSIGTRVTETIQFKEIDQSYFQTRANVSAHR